MNLMLRFVFGKMPVPISRDNRDVIIQAFWIGRAMWNDRTQRRVGDEAGGWRLRRLKK